MLKQPGYGQIKRADTPINLSVSPRSNRIVLNKKQALCVFRPCRGQAADRRISL